MKYTNLKREKPTTQKFRTPTPDASPTNQRTKKPLMHVACSTTEREVLAMVFALHKFRQYLLSNNTFVFYVDNMVLDRLVNKPQVSGRLPRWLLMFLEYDFTIYTNPVGAIR